MPLQGDFATKNSILGGILKLGNWGGRRKGHKAVRTLGYIELWNTNKTIKENALRIGISYDTAYGVAKIQRLKYRKEKE